MDFDPGVYASIPRHLLGVDGGTERGTSVEGGLETIRACVAILENERDKRGLTTIFTMGPHRSFRKKKDDRPQKGLKDRAGLDVSDNVLKFPHRLRTFHKNQSRREIFNFEYLEENGEVVEPDDISTQDSQSLSSSSSSDGSDTTTPPIDLITL